MTLTDQYLENIMQTCAAARRRLAELAAEQATADGQRTTEIARAIRREQRRLDRASEPSAGRRGAREEAPMPRFPRR